MSPVFLKNNLLNMKRILPVLTGLFAAFTSLAQNSNALKVEEFTLRNGFKVYVNEDHLQPRVFGAVVVKAGSNDCLAFPKAQSSVS